jgi:DNA-binding response OmpR family regulator
MENPMSLLTSQRVLILEDEPLIAIAIEDFLYESGIGIVEIAFNCQAARRRILDLWPDFVILDVYLPDRSGYEIADLLVTKAIPFLFVTGLMEADIPPRFRGRPILTKPLVSGALSTLIHRILGANPKRNHLGEERLAKLGA